MTVKFVNFFKSKIADVGGIGSGDIEFTLSAGDGAKMPTLTGGHHCYLVFVDSSSNREVVKVTAVVSDTCTIIRGQDGTTPRAFVQDDLVELRLTKGAIEDIINYVADGATIVFANDGLRIYDTNATHDLVISPGSDLTADRILSLITGDAARTFSLLASLFIGSGYNVTITAEDAAGEIVLDNCGLEVEDTVNAGNIVKLINANDDTDKSITLNESLVVGVGNDGTITFSGASKTLTIEDSAVVDQDLSSDASPTFTGIVPILSGYLQRPVFSRKGIDEIYIGAGAYHHKGTKDQIVYWDSELTKALTGAGITWRYLYLDDSAIVIAGTNLLTPTELIFSTTPPAWDHARHGLYNGLDRCIFGLPNISAVAVSIAEFLHNGDFTAYADEIVDLNNVDIDTDWVEVPLFMPAFATQAECLFRMVGSAGVAFTEGYWRTKGQAGATGKRYGMIDNSLSRWRSEAHIRVTADGSQIIEVKNSTSSIITTWLATHGWYFPIGM